MRTGMKRTFVFIFVFKCPCSKSSASVLALTQPLTPIASAGGMRNGITGHGHGSNFVMGSFSISKIEIPILDTGLGRFGFTQKKIASEATKIVGPFRLGQCQTLQYLNVFFLKLILKPYVEPSDSIEERNGTDSSDPPLKRKRQIGNEKDPPPLLFSFTYP